MEKSFEEKECQAGWVWAQAHPVLLMRAEVKEDMQVLELARRSLEDQVSKCRHAQVGATLQMEAMLSLLCSLTFTSPPSLKPSLQDWTLTPPLPPSLQHRSSKDAYLILTILPYHLQGTLGDQWGLQNHLGEYPAQERHRSCWRSVARQPASQGPRCTTQLL